MEIISKIMKAWNGYSHIIAGILGGFIAVGIMHWFALPDHNTIDMLSFTESAFGIGMTVIALVFSLVLVNQVKEIDRRFDEKSKEIDEKMNDFEARYVRAMEALARNTPPAVSGMIVGFQNATTPVSTSGIIVQGRTNKNV